MDRGCTGGGGCRGIDHRERITAVARNGRIFVQTPSGLGAGNLSAQFTATFPVTGLTVDGQSTTYTQTGSQANAAV